MGHRFRVYYADREPYDGEGTADAMRAPTTGALLVKQAAPSNVNGFSIRTATFFCWETYAGVERWGGKDDLFGLAQYWMREPGAQKVITGMEVDDKLYQDIRAQAVDDGYLDKRREG
jgi:hypothetical protein